MKESFEKNSKKLKKTPLTSRLELSPFMDPSGVKWRKMAELCRIGFRKSNFDGNFSQFVQGACHTSLFSNDFWILRAFEQINQSINRAVEIVFCSGHTCAPSPPKSKLLRSSSICSTSYESLPAAAPPLSTPWWLLLLMVMLLFGWWWFGRPASLTTVDVPRPLERGSSSIRFRGWRDAAASPRSCSTTDDRPPSDFVPSVRESILSACWGMAAGSYVKSPLPSAANASAINFLSSIFCTESHKNKHENI